MTFALPQADSFWRLHSYSHVENRTMLMTGMLVIVHMWLGVATKPLQSLYVNYGPEELQKSLNHHNVITN